MKKLDVLAAALLVIGGLNWGLVAVAQFDLVRLAWSDLDFGQPTRSAASSTAWWASRRSTRSPSSMPSASGGATSAAWRSLTIRFDRVEHAVSTMQRSARPTRATPT